MRRMSKRIGRGEGRGGGGGGGGDGGGGGGGSSSSSSFRDVQTDMISLLYISVVSFFIYIILDANC